MFELRQRLRGARGDLPLKRLFFEVHLYHFRVKLDNVPEFRNFRVKLLLLRQRVRRVHLLLEAFQIRLAQPQNHLGGLVRLLHALQQLSLLLNLLAQLDRLRRGGSGGGALELAGSGEHRLKLADSLAAAAVRERILELCADERELGLQLCSAPDSLLICHHRVLHQLRALSEFQRRLALVCAALGRRNAREQSGAGPPTQSVLEQEGELAVAVRHVAFFAVRNVHKGFDDVAEGGEALVDRRRLLQARTRSFAVLLALGASQIHEMERCVALAEGTAATSATMGALKLDGKDAVRPRRFSVHRRLPDAAILRASRKACIGRLRTIHQLLVQALHEGSALGILAHRQVGTRVWVEQIVDSFVVNFEVRTAAREAQLLFRCSVGARRAHALKQLTEHARDETFRR
mmetsp:Transcript_14460/g.47499  ORF Transcript_14460/g.47499 Transcript_14460/m.47499 type:complete len:404 (-) Transcript_14460:303-1514(-)